MARKAAEDIEDLDLEDFDDADEAEEATAKGKGKGKTKKESAPKGVSAGQLAVHIGAEPKTFRAWLRRKLESEDSGLDMDRDPKTRYDFGPDFDSPLVKQIVELWNSESHEKGAGIEKAQAARKAKAAEKAKTSAKPKAKASKK